MQRQLSLDLHLCLGQTTSRGRFNFVLEVEHAATLHSPITGRGRELQLHVVTVTSVISQMTDCLQIFMLLLKKTVKDRKILI